MKTVGQIYRENLAQTLLNGAEEQENVFLVSYSQLNSNKIGELRKELKKAGANMFVARNTIAKRVLKELDTESLLDNVTDQTAFVWSNSDSVTISKILVEFSKDKDSFNVQGGILDGKALAQSDVKRLSDLPSREVLLSTLLGTIQAPVTRLLGAFNAKSRDLLSILKQLSEKKGGS